MTKLSCVKRFCSSDELASTTKGMFGPVWAPGSPQQTQVKSDFKPGLNGAAAVLHEVVEKPCMKTFKK